MSWLVLDIEVGILTQQQRQKEREGEREREGKRLNSDGSFSRCSIPVTHYVNPKKRFQPTPNYNNLSHFNIRLFLSFFVCLPLHPLLSPSLSKNMYILTW